MDLSMSCHLCLVWVDAGVTLGPPRPTRFSKTARSCPPHGETGRNRLERPTLAIHTGRLPHDPVERAAERTQTGEPHVEADVGDVAVGPAEQVHRPFDATTLQVTVGCLSEGRSERTDEVSRGQVGDGGECRDVEMPAIRAVHGVAGSQQPAVQLLDGLAHQVTGV